MIGLIQRVSQAEVTVEEKIIGKIDNGILLLLGVEKNDATVNAERLLNKTINLRIFADQTGKMNLSLLDIEASILIVPQFTLAADTQKGTRPSFASAAPPELGKELFDKFTKLAKDKVSDVKTGKFGADMQVALINDGPVTFSLQF